MLCLCCARSPHTADGAGHPPPPSVFLAAKLQSGDAQLEAQGAHGFWELATNKAYYPLFTAEFLSHILRATRSHHAGAS